MSVRTCERARMLMHMHTCACAYVQVYAYISAHVRPLPAIPSASKYGPPTIARYAPVSDLWEDNPNHCDIAGIFHLRTASAESSKQGTPLDTLDSAWELSALTVGMLRDKKKSRRSERFS